MTYGWGRVALPHLSLRSSGPEPGAYDFEDLPGLAGQVFKEKRVAEMPHVWSTRSEYPVGTAWEFADEEEMARRLPRLYSRCWAGQGSPGPRP